MALLLSNTRVEITATTSYNVDMSIFEAIALGIVQGITEFLPISSSGHLILLRSLFGVNDAQGLAFVAAETFP